MRISTKIRFAIDMIAESPLNFCISVLLSGIGFALFGFTMLVYLAGNEGMRSAQKVLSNGIKQAGIIEVDDYYLATGLEFRKQAYASKMIDSIGAFSYAQADRKVFQQLYEVQQGRALNQNQEADQENLQMLVVDQELLSLCNLQFDQDKLHSYRKSSNEKIQYLYLGNAYKKIPVGTEFLDSSQGTTVKYKVAGILKKDTCFASQDLISGIDFTTLRSDINMNYEIICVNEEASVFSPWMFAVNKKYSLKEAQKELKQIAEQTGVTIKEYSLQSLFDKAHMETEIMQDSLLEMLVLLVITIAVIVTSLQIVEILHRSHIYGILYGVGFLSPEINAMMVIRNGIYFIFSVAIGDLMLLLIGKKYFITNVQVKEMFFRLLLQQVFPTGSVFMLLLFLVVTVIPCIIFNRQDPVTLLYKN